MAQESSADTTRILDAVSSVKREMLVRIDEVKTHVENHDRMLRGDAIGKEPGLVEVVRKLSGRFAIIMWLVSIATTAIVGASAIDLYQAFTGG